MGAKDSLKDKVLKLEYHLKAFIESLSTSHFMASPLDPREMAAQLRQVLQENCQVLEDGRVLAPNYFLLAASPLFADKLRKEKQMLAELEAELERLALEAGLSFASPPVIHVVDDEELPYHQVSVSGHFSQEVITTRGMAEGEGEKESEGQIPQNAFLIVDGVRIFPLDKPVVNIGRHPDNHLVLEDPRVSRRHAQLRAVRGQYILFDLGSRGGTMVNNLRVRQAILSSGDVISLAGVPLVYGEDSRPLDSTQTLLQTPR
ncbi:MAG: FHA domain-containing protein [Anaerolineales bacterium]|nr:FHA domain-containing protein [Anaerolineales bacterium]MDW8160540.1 DUF3662 domain-containing protein [Anaerolineales bacterium]